MKNFLIFFALVSSSVSFSQKRATIENIRSEKAICKAFAEKSIAELENGTLLVRLDFRQREVDYYLSKGNAKEASRVTEEQLKINRSIVEAFEKNYTFSSVYFFPMKDSEFIASHQFDSVTFYTTSFEIDSVFSPEANAYLIAEFGKTRQDTTKYYSDNVPNTSRENPKEKQYYGGGKNTRSALIVMARDFNQIREPFPYFAPYSGLNSIKNRFQGPVDRLNDSFLRYYKRVNEIIDSE